MTDVFPFELVRLTDHENEVRVVVASVDDAAFWEAEIAVTSMFVKGRTLLMLSREKLEAWSRALDRLALGENVTWMEQTSGPTVRIELDGERDCPEVIVEDESISMVTVRVPIALDAGWIADQQERVRRFIEQC
ncbi:DUF5959 family protein [Saccharothrix sp. NRRL B-16314]|uniref:DUF5959 family protein n=1 Tax=Saccharothrix sp. NRRL B-16314 TaxID=1463825 RepID=UPI0012DF313D|nr:DUF5959 family protein [Saccharothrix sp. NRRL B-16314]